MSPYRQGAHVEPAPKRILEEEMREAEDHAAGAGAGMAMAGTCLGVFGSFAAGHPEEPALATATGFCALAFLGAGLVYYRARRVIRAWRDQKRGDQ